MPVYNVGVSNDTASKPTSEPKIPNDPAGGAGSSPFKSPGAWAPWTQPESQSFMAPRMPGRGPGVPGDASGGQGMSNHTSPLAQTLLGGPGGSPVDYNALGPKTQGMIQSNNQFVGQYQQQQQQQRNELIDALQGVAGMATYTNPFSGYSSQGNVSY